MKKSSQVLTFFICLSLATTNVSAPRSKETVIKNPTINSPVRKVLAAFNNLKKWQKIALGTTALAVTVLPLVAFTAWWFLGKKSESQPENPSSTPGVTTTQETVSVDETKELGDETGSTASPIDDTNSVFKKHFKETHEQLKKFHETIGGLGLPPKDLRKIRTVLTEILQTDDKKIMQLNLGGLHFYSLYGPIKTNFPQEINVGAVIRNFGGSAEDYSSYQAGYDCARLLHLETGEFSKVSPGDIVVDIFSRSKNLPQQALESFASRMFANSSKQFLTEVVEPVLDGLAQGDYRIAYQQDDYVKWTPSIKNVIAAHPEDISSIKPTYKVAPKQNNDSAIRRELKFAAASGKENSIMADATCVDNFVKSIESEISSFNTEVDKVKKQSVVIDQTPTSWIYGAPSSINDNYEGAIVINVPAIATTVGEVLLTQKGQELVSIFLQQHPSYKENLDQALQLAAKTKELLVAHGINQA